MEFDVIKYTDEKAFGEIRRYAIYVYSINKRKIPRKRLNKRCAIPLY